MPDPDAEPRAEPEPEPGPGPDLAVQAERLVGLVGSLGDALTASSVAMTELGDRMDAQLRFGERNRSLIHALVAMAVLQAVFVAVVAYGWVANRHSIDRAADKVATTCEETNVTRAKNVQLWDEALRVTQPAATPDQQARNELFRAFVADTFRPRNCSA